MTPAVFHADALAELVAAQEWDDAQQPGLGRDLLDEVKRAVSKIVADPGIGPRHDRSSLRFYRVSRFPDVIYYQDLRDHVWIAAVAHERRRQGYWKKRQPE